MLKVGIIGFRGMVGTVLQQRMQEEKDLENCVVHYFSTSQAEQVITIDQQQHETRDGGAPTTPSFYSGTRQIACMAQTKQGIHNSMLLECVSWDSEHVTAHRHRRLLARRRPHGRHLRHRDAAERGGLPALRVHRAAAV